MSHPRLDENEVTPCDAFGLCFYSLTASNHNDKELKNKKANTGERRDTASTTNLFEKIEIEYLCSLLSFMHEFDKIQTVGPNN